MGISSFENARTSLSRALETAQASLPEWRDRYAYKEPLSESSFAEIPPIEPGDLAQYVATHTDPYAANWYVPTSFSDDNERPLSLLPIDGAPCWEMLELLHAHESSSGFLLLAPLFWQIELFYAAIARKLVLPVVTTLPKNTPAAREMIRQLALDGVVATQSSAFALREALEKLPESPVRIWHIMLEPEEPQMFSAKPRGARAERVYFERHVLPGLPALFQCEFLAGTEHYHANDRFYWELQQDAEALLTIHRDTAYPLIRLKTPWKLVEHDACQCGRTVVAVD